MAPPARNANHISSSGRWGAGSCHRAAAASAATVRGVLRLWRNGSVVRYQSSRNSRRVQCARGRRDRSPGSCLSSRLMLSTLLARDGGMHGHWIPAMRKRRRLPRRRHAGAGVPWVPCGADSKAGFRLQVRVQLTDIADRLAWPKIQSRRLGVDGQLTRRDAS